MDAESLQSGQDMSQRRALRHAPALLYVARNVSTTHKEVATQKSGSSANLQFLFRASSSLTSRRVEINIPAIDPK